ncbi:MAG: acetyl-CoA carboxylase biotin carboxyl carrier protein subunit [Bacteroidales bacterium]|jgi:pyruvate carboxylase|nr:acetyl-CoA carboxylase biotin carboxyl carrier protein subunit [Bacteroidales bacterium]MDI9576284.1 acetyl-CoA carboxylase biotin carboxyl carrier protein subunit [Bacteroidota bacterium]MDD2594012.1 acetyl-CoA carboxylase biotin carboxyl carrier protein subunit [Bacteroidales bacterium]MDD3756309.1 acetyl-CoA carboxylase biotin carboxyl carrier protein subunit [Bacteroidales bacterium]MDY0401587.1 acetyl-CoA carboxylase biotin carboxyl carrier protein subunit [Bacteroidales bacterium]
MKEDNNIQNIENEKLKFEEITINEATYYTIIPDKYKKRKTFVKKNPNQVFAFIPGVIEKIRVNVKDEINKGDILCDLVAMKMNNKVLAPIDGIIKKIYVKEGDTVPKDHLLFEITPKKVNKKQE